ncbi:hypothetical protein B0H10DRAFT_1813221 [Mycena sp. CBHHK59/15]|nr:hypothetical protein B0H10DRAFT_1825818 [Mycena sp. CBHHK59/15]KAJ6609676.1 hypothetical protein B0H10DRAFT_1813221 [Mycena sp. CBHHK59/15]
MSLRSQTGGSRRWNHFHAALELAIQWSAHKLKFEDFAERFPQYVEEDKDGALQTFTQVADYIQSTNMRDLQKLFHDYDLQKNIDFLDRIVNEAEARKARGDIGSDVWKEDLHPRSAVCGRTIPILEAQAKRLRDSLARLEAENEDLASRLQDAFQETDDLEARALRMLDKVDETHEAWSRVPMDKIEAWTAQVAETLTPTLRS